MQTYRLNRKVGNIPAGSLAIRMFNVEPDYKGCLTCTVLPQPGLDITMAKDVHFARSHLTLIEQVDPTRGNKTIGSMWYVDQRI